VTGRAGVAVIFAACFLGLLVADLARWAELADAVFFLAATLTAYYVRPHGLLPVVVSPPLLFFFASVTEKATARLLSLASGSAGILGGTVAVLGTSVGWLLAGTVVTIVIALLRGLRGQLQALVLGTHRQALPGDLVNPAADPCVVAGESTSPLWEPLRLVGAHDHVQFAMICLCRREAKWSPAIQSRPADGRLTRQSGHIARPLGVRDSGLVTRHR
jgi:hypothetical protein